MKKVIGFVTFIFLLLSASPYREDRILKEYSSVVMLAWDLGKGYALNKPYYDIVRSEYEDVGTVFTPLAIMKMPLVDTVIYDEVYGETFISDENLRYISHLAEYYHFEPVEILLLVQASNKYSLTRRQIEERVSWAYRIRSLGISEEYILSEYKNLKEGFFK